MRKLLTILLLSLSICSSFCQTKRALLIGIGDYPEGSGWSKIHGDNDVDIIKPYLLKNGFQDSDIKVLLNEKAKKKNIMASLKSLEKDAQEGDVFYIHFSGHGQEFKDFNGDEDNGYDESWVPYDARIDARKGYDGENHIIDDELNEYLVGLRTKVGDQGKIVVVSDACHSGSGTRDFRVDSVDIEYTRGTDFPFIPMKPHNAKGNNRSNELKWLHVAACKPEQSNYELYDKASGTFYGSLSFVIAKSEGNLSDFKKLVESWKEYFSKIQRHKQDFVNEGSPSDGSKSLF